MPMPIAVADGICFAFPDVLDTPVPGSSPVPIPYPNIAQLSSATGTASTVTAGGKQVITEDSSIPSSSGGEPGTIGGGGNYLGECSFPSGSSSVTANGSPVIRQFDQTDQNGGNASGMVMVGNPTVLVGG